MKHLIALFLMMVMVFSLSACGSDKDTTTQSGSDPTVAENNDSNNSNGATISIDSVKSAKETDSSKFKYRDVDGGISITDFEGEDEIVVIPQSIDGKTVVSIEKPAFVNNETMRGLKISDTVQTIGSHAFENCVSLKVFVSGTALESICEYAFGGCRELTDVKLNDGLKSLGVLCFGGTNMSELYIPESVETIDTPFLKNEDKTLKIISASGSEAENFVSLFGEELNIVFEAK